jgi:hypothetical protein
MEEGGGDIHGIEKKAKECKAKRKGERRGKY